MCTDSLKMVSCAHYSETDTIAAGEAFEHYHSQFSLICDDCKACVPVREGSGECR